MKLKKTDKSEGVKKKVGKVPKPEAITPEEGVPLLYRLSSGQRLLRRIENDLSEDIPDEQERGQAKARKLAEIEDRVKHWRSEIEKDPDWPIIIRGNYWLSG